MASAFRFGKISLTREQLIVVGIAFSLILLPLLVLAVRVVTSPSASAGSTPQEVIISNITGNSFTVSYTTTEPATGVISVSGANQTLSVQDRRDLEEASQRQRRTHYFEVSNLAPNSEYGIRITSQGATVDAGTATTLSASESISTPSPLFGKVDVTSVTEGIAYIIAGNASGNTTIASAPMSNNTFSIEASNLLTGEGRPIRVSDRDRDFVVYVVVPGSGKAKSQVAASSAPNMGDLTLSEANITFDPNAPITPGNTGTETPLPESFPTTPPPTTTYKLDAFSESLLTSKYSTGAEETNPYAPYNIFISNVTPNTFTVVWQTKQPATGYIEVIEQGQFNPIVDPRDGNINNAKRRYTHLSVPENGGIPAGTTFDFVINSNGVRYGRNIQEIASAYNAGLNQFAANKEARVNSRVFDYNVQAGVNTSTGVTTGTGTETNTGTNTNAVQNPTPVPFQVIIPGSPSSAPIPLALQGTAALTLEASEYTNNINTLASRNPELLNPAVDLSRDIIVAAKTASGTWVSSTVQPSGTFSISLGSGITTDKDRFITVTDGTALQVFSIGSFNQSIEQTLSFDSDATPTITLNNPLAFTSIHHGTVVNQALLAGLSSPNSSVTVNLNNTSSQVSANNRGFWQLATGSLVDGANTISVTSGTKTTSTTFVVDPIVLPVTSLTQEQTMMLLGLILLASGLLLRQKYAKRTKLVG